MTKVANRDMIDYFDCLKVDYDAAKADLAKAREALEWIASHDPDYIEPDQALGPLADITTRARAVLTSLEKPE